jgi:hypothetical protein
MTKAKVFSRKSDGVITMLVIEDSTVGTLPEDRLTGEQVAFVNRNGEALAVAITMSLLHIAQAKTPAEKKKAATIRYAPDVAADSVSAEEARRTAQDILRQAESDKPVIEGLDETGNPKKD